MAGEVLNMILDGLDEDMLDNYNAYAYEAVEPWLSFSGNNGQLVIVKKYIIPAAEQHAKKARPNWPESDNPDNYIEDLMNCYDPEVMDRAFSDMIQSIAGGLFEYWTYASGVQWEHASLVPGENQGPHSTWPVWRGTPYAL